MNKQKLFNDVVAGFRAQNWVRALVTDLDTGGSICAYRGDNNTKCAIGILIPDELYSPEMEGASIKNMLSSDNVLLVLRKCGYSIAEHFAKKYGFDRANYSHTDFLNNLQDVHDEGADDDDDCPSLEDALREFAKQQHLTWPK